MSIFIGNISELATKEDIFKEFSVFGKCELEYFARFAFCNYKKSTDAAEAVKY